MPRWDANGKISWTQGWGEGGPNRCDVILLPRDVNNENDIYSFYCKLGTSFGYSVQMVDIPGSYMYLQSKFRLNEDTSNFTRQNLKYLKWGNILSIYSRPSCSVYLQNTCVTATWPGWVFILSKCLLILGPFMIFSAPALLVQKSYCYTPGVSVGVGVGVHMQNVRANVKVLEFKSFCIFSCILTLLIILIKPLTTKAYDRRASGDCGTSGLSGSKNWRCGVGIRLDPPMDLYLNRSVVGRWV